MVFMSDEMHTRSWKFYNWGDCLIGGHFWMNDCMVFYEVGMRRDEIRERELLE